jgi:acyl-CoA reductase-like NAD-dependent aldehyde dehydrogenase
MRRRIAAIERFRELVIARTDALADTLTQEVGKPIRQSRNELKGLVGRLDFFIAESARALRGAGPSTLPPTSAVRRGRPHNVPRPHAAHRRQRAAPTRRLRDW